MINQPPESRFAASLKPFFDSIDPFRTWANPYLTIDLNPI
jgi:hypothetical protein